MHDLDAAISARHSPISNTALPSSGCLRSALMASASALVLAQVLLALPAMATSGPCTSDTSTTPGTTLVSCTGTINGAVSYTHQVNNLILTSNANITTTGGTFAISAGSAGNTTITSSGAISTTDGGWGIAAGSGGGNTTITVSGAVSTTGGSTSYGIYGSSSVGNTTVTLTDTGSLSNTHNMTSNSSAAIYASSGPTGTTTLNNAGTITGNVRLTGGSVAFNNQTSGVFNTGNWVVIRDGLGTLTNAGTVSPGGNGTIQTTTLTGNYVQTSTGVLKVDADWTGNSGAGAADKLAISGTATLAGTVIVNPLNFPTTGGLNKQFTVLTADGGITNNGISIANTAAVNYALLFTDHDHSLDVQATINFQGVGITGLTGNQSAVGGSLNTILGGGTTLGFMPALMTLPSAGQLGGALDQLAPVGDGGSNASAMATGSTFAGQLLSCRVAGEGDAHAVIREGQCVWARASARRLDRDNSADSTGLHETATFVSGGVQVKLGGDWRLGGGIGYEDTALATASNATSKGERLHLGGVLKYNPGPWLFAGAITGGHGWHDNIRRVSFGGFDAVATSDSETSFVAGRLTAAYLHQMGPLYLKPQIEVASTHLNRDGYNETGTGGIALAVREASATVWSASPSLELGTEVRSAGGVTRLFLKGGVTWLDTDTFMTSASFLGAPGGTSPFAVTSKLDSVVADVGAGIDLITKGDTALRLQYDGQFGETTTQHIGSAKLGVKF